MRDQDPYPRGFDPQRDRDLVRRLLADGGLPRVVQTPSGGVCLAGPDGLPWRLSQTVVALAPIPPIDGPKPRPIKRGSPPWPAERIVRPGTYAAKALAAINRGNRTSSSLDMAIRMNNPHAASQLLRKLFDLGLLDRAPAPSGHGFLWSLSDKGRGLLAAIEGVA